MVFERDALFLDVVDKLYATVLHRTCCSDIFVASSCTLIHCERQVGCAGADTLVAWHFIQEVVERLSLETCACSSKCCRAVVGWVERDGERSACGLCCKGNHLGLLVGVVLEETEAHAALDRQIAEHVLLATALVPVAWVTELALPCLGIALAIVGLRTCLVGDDGEL